MLEINPTKKIQRINKDITETEVEGNVVLLHIENGQYYNFNKTGSDLWNGLAQPLSMNELVKLIVDKYSITTDDCQKDILVWLNDAFEHKLIQFVD